MPVTRRRAVLVLLASSCSKGAVAFNGVAPLLRRHNGWVPASTTHAAASSFATSTSRLGPLFSASVSSGFDKLGDVDKSETMEWDQLDDPKFDIPDVDREYLLQMKAELPEVLVPDLEPEELMTEEQIQEELDRHKMMLSVVDEADLEFNSTTWAVLDAETGDMVEWFDEEEPETTKDLEYWELAQSDFEDPRFKPRWNPDPPSKYNYKNPPNTGGGFTWDKIRDRAEWHQFDENLKLKTDEGWHRFDYKEVHVRDDFFDINAANLTHGHIDPRVVERIQPCLNTLGKAVELLEASDGVVRFLYHGLIKDKVGVEAYAKMLMEQNGYPEIKSVLCECQRVRDYDGFEASYF